MTTELTGCLSALCEKKQRMKAEQPRCCRGEESEEPHTNETMPLVTKGSKHNTPAGGPHLKHHLHQEIRVRLTIKQEICPSVCLFSEYLGNHSSDPLQTLQVCCWELKEVQC